MVTNRQRGRTKVTRSESMPEWVGGSYDLDGFDPTTVVFDDPKQCWKRAFSG